MNVFRLFLVLFFALGLSPMLQAQVNDTDCDLPPRIRGVNAPRMAETPSCELPDRNAPVQDLKCHYKSCGGVARNALGVPPAAWNFTEIATGREMVWIKRSRVGPRNHTLTLPLLTRLGLPTQDSATIQLTRDPVTNIPWPMPSRQSYADGTRGVLVMGRNDPQVRFARLRTNFRTIQISGEQPRNDQDRINPFIIATSSGFIMGVTTRNRGMWQRFYNFALGEVPVEFSAYSYGGNLRTPVFLSLAPFRDSGLRIFDGTNTLSFAALLYGGSPSPMRFRNADGEDVDLVLVPITDPAASKVRVSTPDGVRALRSFP